MDLQIFNQIRAYCKRQLEKKIINESKGSRLCNQYWLELNDKHQCQRDHLDKELDEFKNEYIQWKNKPYISSISITKCPEQMNESNIVQNTKYIRNDESNNKELYRFKTKLGIYVLKESNKDELIRPRERLKNIPLYHMNRLERPNKLNIKKCY